MDDLTGRPLGPYQITVLLGEGGMAAVYKAYQPGMDRHVALKILSRHLTGDPGFLSRFRQEAHLIAKLQHPHILAVYDFGQAEGYSYIVMPLVESGTLAGLLRGQPLPPKHIQRVIAQVGDALDYAHAFDVIHRDVKPGNVLLDQRGNCLLSDFGIARLAQAQVKRTATGSVMGTPAYMSPEQGLGQRLDARSDIYSLGVILYEMATGRVPFEADTPVALGIKHAHEPLPPPRDINPALLPAVEAVIVKALAKRPEARYQTAGELVEAISAATATSRHTAASRPESSPGSLPPTAPTHLTVHKRPSPSGARPEASAADVEAPATAEPGRAAHALRIEFGYRTGSGRSRQPTDQAEARQLVTASGLELMVGIVADGGASDEAGDRAARLTLEKFFEACQSATQAQIPQLLRAALEQANTAVWDEARARDARTVSTAAVAAIHQARLYLANVGNGRIYLLRNNTAAPLTLDHTWASENVRAGKLDSSEAWRHPRRDEVVRLVGLEPSLKVDLGVWLRQGTETDEEALEAQGLELQPGDRVLLCSDGLIRSRAAGEFGSHRAEPEEMARIIYRAPARRAAEALVNWALARQEDDVSAVVLEVHGRRQASPALRPRLAMAVLGFTLVALAAVLVPQAAGVVARRSLTPTPTAMPPPIPLGHVAEVSGQVESRSPGAAYVLLYRGATLLPADGTLIRTTGSHAYAKLSLADGSTLFVGPDALVELRAVTGSQSARDIQVVLESGRLLVAADPTRRSGFIVRTRTGAYALALGSLMGAEFDREAQALDVDCFQGACEIGGESLRQALRLSGGQHARADAAGIARGSVGTRNERFSFGDFGGGLIPTPTHIPTPTPTTTPTNTPTDTPTRKPTSAAALTPTDAPSPPPSETPTQPPPPPPADTLAGPTLAPPPEETTPTLAPPPP